jgi:membrane protease YdiL (CAAX protease family)
MISENFAQELSLIVLILLYGTVLARLVPRRFHIYLNFGIAVTAIVLGFGFGLTPKEMGVSIYTITSGIFIAIAASVVIAVATLIIAIIPPLRKYFLGDNLSKASGKLIAFEAGIRIPFSTALIEEVLFRGVLLGLLLTHYSTPIALLYASIVFGLWHIFPTIATLEQNDATIKAIANKKHRKYAGVVGTVAITTVAGLLFGYLRILANSIIAPWLVHWTINSSGVAGIYVARKITERAQFKEENHE